MIRSADAVIRFLVSDVDGTLVTPDKTITADARAAVASLGDAGIGFAFVSSRPPRGLASIADTLGLRVPDGTDAGTRPVAAAFNGGALLDGHLRPIAFTPLGDVDARVALDCFASMGIDAWIFTLDEWLLVDPSGHYVPLERRTVGFDARVVPDFASLGPEVMRGIGKIVGSSADAALLARAEAQLATTLSPAARALRSQSYYLDVTHADANKGAALRAIADHAGLSIDAVAAIGDMPNDLAMLDIAGFSIAMGNGPDDMKRRVDAVTSTNADEGFAHAIRTLVLPRAATNGEHR